MNLLDFDDTRDRLLGRCLRRQAEKVPDTDFIVWDEEHFSYGRVNELANAYARGFRELGVKPGDSVSFMMETCPEYVWATLAFDGKKFVLTNHHIVIEEAGCMRKLVSVLRQGNDKVATKKDFSDTLVSSRDDVDLAPIPVLASDTHDDGCT